MFKRRKGAEQPPPASKPPQKEHTQIRASWRGTAVSVNRMHMPIAHKKGRRVIHTPEYRAFLESLTLAFLVHRPAHPIEGAFDVLIIAIVGPRFDPDNVIKPVIDAIQNAGIVANDKASRNIVLQAPIRHKQERDDVISVIVTDAEIIPPPRLVSREEAEAEMPTVDAQKVVH